MTRLKIIFSFVLASLLISGTLLAQPEPSRQELENVLSRFINYRFGTISIYKIKNPSDIKRALKTKSEVGAGKKEAEELLKSIEPAVALIITRGAEGGDECDKIRNDIIGQGLIPPDGETFDKICSGLKSGGIETDQVENAYIITNRPVLGQPPTNIIAMITSERAADDLERNLRSRPTSDIYTYDEMMAFKLDTTFSASNLYDLMINAIMQGNIENKTLDAQGIGNPEWFSSKTFGKTNTLTMNEADISSNDIQKFVRISDAQALDYTYNNNELIASMDLISWKKYPLVTYFDQNTGDLVVDSFWVTNEALPEFGVELRYGIPEISYPSLWSERLTLSAIWQSVKLGIILPTAGWSQLGESVYNVNRKLTYAGFGVAGTFDFPFKVIPQSGVFRASLGYVFGDAQIPGFKTEPTIDNYNSYFNDYLIRANAQLHYTFGVSVDDDYWFRFGIGGTVYSAEFWNYKLFNNEETNLDEIRYIKTDSETIGGISGRVEFMSKNILTPFGASIQYFDEALGATVWLQIPVIPQTFSLRLDASGYFVAFRDAHLWENNSVFMPHVRFIFNF